MSVVPTTPAVDPHAEYSRRLEARRAAAAEMARQERRLSDLRLLAAAVTVIAGATAIGTGLFSVWFAVAPLIGFAALVVLHDRTIRRGHRARQSVRYYELGLARLEDRWAGTGNQGARWREASHPYAADLDLFGPGSLFELMCSARTRDGEAKLAGWLLAPSEPEVVRRRQAAVEELRNRLNLREDLALLGEAVRGSLDVEAAAKWGSAPVTLTSQPLRWLALALAAGVAATGVAWAMGFGPLPFGLAALLGQAFAAPLGRRVHAAVSQVEQTARELALLARLLQRVEGEQFESPLLRRLSAGLDTTGAAPSHRLAKLEQLVSVLQMQRNGIFALIALALLWPTHCAFAIEAWRAENGPLLADWIEAAGEFEALSSLAGYAYEHPSDPFPTVIDEGRVFEANGLGHPLLPTAKCVRNDLRLGDDLRLMVISGSNMSGKSTLMRAVGVNTVLALAGAPVRASALTVSPLAIGASIRIQDSLQEGISHFYAEILRLRQVVELSRGGLPLLFLLDEILHGTNSHDRLIGAEAVVRSLVASGSVGLVSTHDLALAKIVDDAALRAVNAHFEDQIVEGKMQFDYRLRPGVVQKSNALELMRSVGLDV